MYFALHDVVLTFNLWFYLLAHLNIRLCPLQRREAPVPKSHESMLLGQRQVLNKVNVLLQCVSQKCHFCVRMFGRYVSCEELIIISDCIHFYCKSEWIQDRF